MGRNRQMIYSTIKLDLEKIILYCDICGKRIKSDFYSSGQDYCPQCEKNYDEWIKKMIRRYEEKWLIFTNATNDEHGLE